MKTLKQCAMITCLFAAPALNAHERINPSQHAPSYDRSVMSGCMPASAQADLDINNVRTTILNGGDMWWDLSHAQYEIPKGSNRNSLYAGSLWIGGLDDGGQLKVAAMTYRQGGNDFWPGPLDPGFAGIDAATCNKWDKIFIMTRHEVENFVATGHSTDAIDNWPAMSPGGGMLAPYYDANANGVYDPYNGDYPDYDLTGTRGCNAKLFGDKTLWWVFNDKGNIHTETGGTNIGLEIQAQAFAFSTNDEINDMTFYKYKIINRSSAALNSTYIGMWVDPDLGGADDDYVGCDVGRGLGYCYNGDLIDDASIGGELTYGANPPAIGVDFFEGPYADANGMADPADSSANGIGYNDILVDNERLGMEKFVYYINGAASGMGDPSSATEYYQYLSGRWTDNSYFTYGGSGHLSSSIKCDYIFPGDSDPNGFGTNGVSQVPWDETTAGNAPKDRRFLESSGPFTLAAGAVNYVTTGVVWARATQGGNLASISLMKSADTKAQALFNNCFKILDGPTAPDLGVQELDRELIFTLDQATGSNNAHEDYQEKDPFVTSGSDTVYKFEGYQVYQLKEEAVSVTDLNNIDKARLVMQCDLKNGVGQIINFYNDAAISAWVPQEKVNGTDNGIMHSFQVTEDKFATSSSRLINHKTYYYMVIAYAYNQGEVTTNPYTATGSNLPYLAGRKNVRVYSAIPHIPSPEAGGTNQNSWYNAGPKLKRIEGQGNGGNILDLTSETVDAILSSSNGRIIEPVYENGRGPVNIKVVDPLNMPDDEFTFKLDGLTGAAHWTLKRNSNGEVIHSERTIAIANEQVILKWGMSVTVKQVKDPDNGATTEKGGFLEATMTFADPSKQWLSGLPDQDGATPANWIRAGNSWTPSPGNTAFDDRGKPQPTPLAPLFIDPQANYEKILGGTWAPYALCAYTDAARTSIAGPAVTTGGGVNILNDSMAFLSSVDIVFTNDRSKWTRCPVLEMEEDSTLAEGRAKKLALRRHASVDKDGAENFGASDNNDFATGMSWFPGYAINIETGERLNMAFGEDSWMTSSNGKNMRWDPVSTIYSEQGIPVFGGKHYIYVFGHNGSGMTTATDPLLPNHLKDVPAYDGGRAIYELLRAADGGVAGSYLVKKNEVFSDCMWVNIPLLADGHTLLETDVKVRLRVTKAYNRAYTARWSTTGAVPSSDTAATPQNTNFPMYTFSTSDLKTEKQNNMAAKNALDIINVVPNPYYGYSAYEKSAIQNLVKITNLPEKCTVSIYGIDGTLVRRFKKDSEITSLDWNLTNDARVPVASGMYLIHVDVPGVGEKILKWFGVMRPQDLDSY